MMIYFLSHVFPPFWRRLLTPPPAAGSCVSFRGIWLLRSSWRGSGIIERWANWEYHQWKSITSGYFRYLQVQISGKIDIILNDWDWTHLSLGVLHAVILGNWHGGNLTSRDRTRDPWRRNLRPTIHQYLGLQFYQFYKRPIPTSGG